MPKAIKKRTKCQSYIKVRSCMNIRLWLPLLIVFGLVIVLGFSLTRNPHQLPSTLIHQPAPIFKGPLLLHPTQEFSSMQFKGHITLFHVFASWCVSCQGEHPILMDIARHFKHVLVIDGLNYKDQRNQVIPWLQQYGNPYHHIIADPLGKIAMQWGVYGTPETFLIDPQGRVQAKIIGPIDLQRWHQQLLPRIVQLLTQAPALSGYKHDKTRG